jgi:hypothetical protein
MNSNLELAIWIVVGVVVAGVIIALFIVAWRKHPASTPHYTNKAAGTEALVEKNADKTAEASKAPAEQAKPAATTKTANVGRWRERTYFNLPRWAWAGIVLMVAAGTALLVITGAIVLDYGASVPKAEAAIPGLSWRFDLPQWPWEIILPIVLGLALFVLVMKKGGSWLKGVTIALLLATFVIWQWPFIQYMGARNGWWSYRGPAMAASYTTDECPGSKEGIRVELVDSGWSDINPTGNCRVISNFKDGSVEFHDDEGVFLSGGWSSRKGLAARATAGVVHAKYSLCPATGRDGPVNWDCSPL